MTVAERLALLRQVDELSSADDGELRCLLPFFDEVLVPAGVAVAQEGRLGHEFIVVANGELEVCRRGRASRLGPGRSFGWATMHDRGRHDATVVTMSPAQLLVMSHSQFRALEAVVPSSVRSVTSSPAQTPNRAHKRPVEPA